ncbi:MAG: hypothetical protein O7F71_00650, partial [Gammaproteobacteria bacterium]|nr:hypothetical protein [Gammaproteobacteria bacterium]
PEHLRCRDSRVPPVSKRFQIRQCPLRPKADPTSGDPPTRDIQPITHKDKVQEAIMEKLQPLLVHKFWILFGITVILPPIGWWTATSDLSKQIKERRSLLETTFNGIPKGTNSPNSDWVEEMKGRNESQRGRNQLAQMNLWDRQKQLMIWPDDIKEIMLDAPYRAKPAVMDVRNQNVPDDYGENYSLEIEKIWRIVEPLSDTRREKRKVQFDLKGVPRIRAGRWDALPPSWREMWDAQEDVWLLASLFEAISGVNAAANSQADAHVKKIEQIYLFGGYRKKPGVVSSKSLRGRGSRQIFGQRKGPLSPVDFSLADEFDNVSSGASSTRNSTRRTSLQQAPQAKTNTDNSRYVDKGELPYRTRGFYLKVTMDHRRVPDVLVELLKSRWHIEIGRVHQGPPNQKGGPLSIGGGSSGSANNASGGEDDDAGGADAGGTDEGSDAEDEDSADTEDDGTDDAGDDEDGGYYQPPSATAPGRASASVDPNLATVVVAGLMTIYNPPKIDEQAADAAGGQVPAQLPAEADPATVAQPVQNGAPGSSTTGAGSATAPTTSANAPNSALTPPNATSGNVGASGQPPASSSSQPAVSNPIQQPSTKD